MNRAVRQRGRASGAALTLFSLVLWALFALPSCADHAPETGAPDASAAAVESDAAAPSAPAERDEGAAKVIAAAQSILASDAELTARLDPAPDGIRRSPSGATTPGARASQADRSRAVSATLPEVASGALPIGLGASPDYRLTLAPRGARSAPLALDRGRAAYLDAFASTDVLFAASQPRVEWMYLMRDERAPTKLAFDVTLPKHLPEAHVEVDGALMFSDENGAAQLRMPRPVLVDATGAHREASLRWNGGALEVAIDPSGLSYPMVLDPAIEVVVWAPRQIFPHPRAKTAMDGPPGGNYIMFGGQGSVSHFADTWQFSNNSQTWTLAATIGPSARRGHGLTYVAGRSVYVLYGGFDAANNPLNDTWEWDGTAWTQKCSSCAPPARGFHAQMVLTSTNDVVVFGGLGAAGALLQDTWTWNGTTWTQAATTFAGGARFAMGAGSPGGIPTVFAGCTAGTEASCTTAASDTYEWNAGAWAQKSTSTSPPARWGVSSFVGTNKLFVVGGRDTTGAYLQSTYRLDATTWTNTLATLPIGTAFAVLENQGAFGPQTHIYFGLRATGVTDDRLQYNGTTTWNATPLATARNGTAAGSSNGIAYHLVRCGGRVGTQTTGTTCATWNGTNWSGGAGGPARFDMAGGGVLNSLSQIFFGGVNGATTYDETWTYDGTAWTQQCTGACVRPSARTGSSIAGGFANGSDGALLFGGSTGGQETWLFDRLALTWTQVCTAAPCSTTRPASRQFASMAFGISNVWLFGGQATSGGAALGDFWKWNGTAWIPVTGITLPPARYRAQMAANQAGHLVLFGGTNGTSRLSDTWLWDGTTWTSLGAAPFGGVDSAGFGWADDRTVFVLTNGATDTGDSADTWELHTRGGACTFAPSCDTGYCIDGVCCEQAVCGTCSACNTTESPGQCTPVRNAVDPDSCAGTQKCDAAGICKKNEGQTCSAASECASGFCVDGYCCGTACAGGCDVCSATPGTCTPRAKGAAGSSPSCGGYVCNGSAGDCPTTCAADADCAAGYFCAAGGVCQPQRSQALGCNTAASGDCMVTGCRECAGTAVCKDGYCCGTACNAACQTCSATPGTCTSVKGADDADSCTGNATCSATGSCLLKNGQSCATATQCASGVCTATYCQPASCGSDTQCSANAYCRTSDGTCQPDQSNGGACASGNQCASGNCADGVCCNTACSGLCQACTTGKTGGASGTCGSVVVGTDPDNECATDAVGSCQKDGTCDGAGACRLYATGTSCGSTTCTGGTSVSSACSAAHACAASSTPCGAYGCNPGGTACNTSCTADPDCAAGYYCAAGGTCLAKKAAGVSCGGANQCTTGNCVDGVCCDTGCNGLCAACTAALKGSGADGACGPIKAASDPQSECADDGANSCQKNGLCNGAGACQLYASGTTCGATTCAGGTQTGYSCDGLGTCKSGNATSCAPYTCGATACRTTCADDTQCVATSFCRVGDGTCQPDQANGASCTLSSQCVSGNCVDGLCCDAPCNGMCQACSAAKKGSGADGTCGSIKVDTDPDGECASSAASTCQQDGNCDGNGACKLWTPGTVCGATTCGNGTQTGYQCDGFGACKSGNNTQCSPYACSGNVCGTSCSDDAGCIAADWCRTSDGKCQPDQGNGASCSSGTQCASGNCVDGVCCDAPCNGSCQACSAAKKGSGADGTCGAIKVDTDPDNECATDAVSTCKQTGFCDGAGACKKYALGTTCGSTTCASGTQTGYQCDGFGTCNAGAATNCAPYTCASGTACGTACASDTGCVATAYCDAGTGTCKGDQTNGASCTGASQCISGFCVDGVCCDQACGGLCQACTVALKGAGANGVCGSVKAGTDPQAECPDDGAASCQRDGLCNGSGACELYAAGAACGASTCASGTQTGYACNGLGTCASASTKQCAPYVCSATTCAASCAGDADCVAADWCRITDASCQPDQANGAACASPTQCSSGNCVDGVCCDAPCGGTCQACSAGKKGSGADGVCGSVKAGTDPDNECNDDGAASCKQDGFCSGAGACRQYASGVACGATACSGGQQTGFACDGAGTCNAGASAACSPYVCNGGSCGVSCASDADCVASAYCDASSHCVPDQPNGPACTLGSQCTSGFCTDGVCCDQACGGACQACAGAKKGDGSADGVCGAVKAGSDPDNDCAIDAPGTCQKDGQCDGSGACRLYALGTACGANTCTGSTLTGQQCDGFGTCTAGKQTVCDPFVCVGTSCAISCADDSGCVATAYCGNNVCQAKVDNAAACVSDHECKSGFCVEGQCCNTACNGICQACTAANKASGQDGVCGDAKDGVDPHGDCTDEGQTSCGRDGKCDGAGACRLYAAGAACGTTSCVGNVQTGFACNGTGQCDPNATNDCGLFACSSGQCKAACADGADCASSAYCDVAGGACKPKDANGKACAAPDTCESGFCVDGLCCNQACSGQCEACDVSTAKGTCSPVQGAPHGGRAACAGGTGATGDAKCAARACDGAKSTATCVGYAGSDVGCRDESCASGVASFSATCNGAGQCGLSDEVQTKACKPFVCGATACKDKCAADADCSAGYKCDTKTGECVSGATCDGDHTITAPGQPDTDCRPYKCQAGGTCRSSCASVDDCMNGFVCADGLCSTATTSGQAASDQTGGCGCRVGERPTGRGAFALLALAGLVAARRRRPSRPDAARTHQS